MIGTIFIMIGLFITAIDITVPIGYDYPAYIKSEELGIVIQKYVIDNMLGDTLKIDIFPDILGYIFLIMGSTMLFKATKKFLKAYIYMLVAAVLSVLMTILPFLFNGRELCVNALVISFLLLLFELFSEYFIVYSFSTITDDLPQQGDNRLMKFGWIGSMMCRVLIYFLIFVGLNKLMLVYQAVLTASVLFYLIRMWRGIHYLPKKR